MAVFITLETEAFDTEYQKRLAGTPARAGLSNVRRPLRGIEVKEDTYAYLKMVRADGAEIPLLSSSSATGETTEYADFMLQSVQDSRMEKHQVVETFGETYIFFFGEAPRFLTVSAVLINSADFQWKHQFLQNYERYLRGTKCVEAGCRVYLMYDENVIEGYIVNASLMETSNDPAVVPLQFQFFVTNAASVAQISENYPLDGAATAGVGDLREPLNGEQIDLLRAPEEGSLAPADTSFLRREIPLRGKIADNIDEFTGGGSSDSAAAAIWQGMEDFPSVHSLPASFGSAMQAYGVSAPVAFSHTTMLSLGLGPTFLPAGVGVGFGAGRPPMGATFGPASPTATPGLGGFAGIRAGAGASAKVGFSAFAGAGASASASAGAFAGQQPGAGFGSPFTTSTAPLTPYDRAYARVTGLPGATSRNPGHNPAYANALALAQFRTHADRPAYNQAFLAARAGGYAGANSSLGFFGAMGASHAGASVTTGASVAVGGRPTAFAYVALPGTLTNAALPPGAAMQAVPHVGISAAWSWPSVL